MKKFITLFSICCFFSCTIKNEVEVVETKNGAKIYTNHGSFSVKELKYKNHLYLYTTVQNGISMTHAAHCSCENN